MDFTLIEKREVGDICYKLLRTNFYRDHYVIIAQDKREFYCGSIKASRSEAISLFNEIANSHTDIYSISDILTDYQRQKVKSQELF